MSGFELELTHIASELRTHKRDKNELAKMYIEERLNKSLEAYLHELDISFDYLSSKDAFNLNRKLRRTEEESK